MLLGLIEQGLVPWVFVEGSYNERLEVIADEDIPAHRMIWMFDATDMERAKAVVGKRQCIGGNVPAALFAMGTTEEMDAYVKDLLGKTAKDGGFILSSGIVLDEADPAAYRAFIDAGSKYGAGGLTGRGAKPRSGVTGRTGTAGDPDRVPRRHQHAAAAVHQDGLAGHEVAAGGRGRASPANSSGRKSLSVSSWPGGATTKSSPQSSATSASRIRVVPGISSTARSKVAANSATRAR